jgi:hypothetical protein
MKSAIVVTSHPFASYEIYLVLLGMGVTIILQVVLLNMSLETFLAQSVVPVYQAAGIITGVAGGLVFFQVRRDGGGGALQSTTRRPPVRQRPRQRRLLTTSVACTLQECAGQPTGSTLFYIIGTGFCIAGILMIRRPFDDAARDDESEASEILGAQNSPETPSPPRGGKTGDSLAGAAHASTRTRRSNAWLTARARRAAGVGGGTGRHAATVGDRYAHPRPQLVYRRYSNPCGLHTPHWSRIPHVSYCTPIN